MVSFLLLSCVHWKSCSRRRREARLLRWYTHMACVFHTIILDELKALEHTTRYDYLIHHRIYQLTRDVELDKETTSKWAIVVFLSSS
jgi:hypothetical protein